MDLSKPAKDAKISTLLVVAAILLFVVAFLLCFVGMRIVYRPDLEIDWVATSAIVTALMTIATFAVAIMGFRANSETMEANRIAREALDTIKRSNDIAEQENKESALRWRKEKEVELRYLTANPDDELGKIFEEVYSDLEFTQQNNE